MDKFLNAFSFLDEILKSESPEDRIVERFYDILGDISIAIVNFREKNNMNQQDLARFMAVTQPMIVKYESGDYNFSLKTLNSICGKLGLELSVKISETISTDMAELDRVNADMASAA